LRYAPQPMTAWTNVARQLCDYLQHTEDKFSLLQKIDSAILTADTTVDSIFDLVLHSLRSILAVPRASVYAFANGGLELLASTDPNQRRSLPRPGAPQHEPGAFAVAGRDGLSPTVADELDCETVLLTPVFGPEMSHLGYLLVESQHPSVLRHLEAPDIVDFVSAVTKQLSIAVEFKEQMRSEAARWLIVDEILKNDMKPSAGFDTVCRRVRDFLPSYSAFAIEPSPATQVLLHSRGDQFLTIVATTGAEPINTRVLLDRSVSGRAVLENRDHLAVDPRDQEAYRSYLGPDMRS
jgi:hypothetical protein